MAPAQPEESTHARQEPRRCTRRNHDRLYRQRLILDVEAVLRAHTLIGQETLGDAILFDAKLIAERNADGAIYYTTGWRVEDGILRRCDRLAMKAHDGSWLIQHVRRPSFARPRIRRSWRQYHAAAPIWIDWMGPDVVRRNGAKDEVGRNVDLSDAEFSHLTGVEGKKIALSFLRDDREVPAQALQASDGKWVAAGYHYVRVALEAYEDRLRTGDVQPEDPFAEIDEEDAGAFAAI